jgi:hypothetical protein
VLAGQARQVPVADEKDEVNARGPLSSLLVDIEGFSRPMILFEAVTISESVNNISQTTTLEKAKSLFSSEG